MCILNVNLILDALLLIIMSEFAESVYDKRSFMLLTSTVGWECRAPLFLKFPTRYGSLSFYLPDHLLLCGVVIVVKWLFYGVLRVWLQCLLVVWPFLPQEGSVCGQMTCYAASDEDGIVIDTTMDIWDIWTHIQNRYPSASRKQVSLSCGVTVTLGPQPNMRTLCACVCACLLDS